MPKNRFRIDRRAAVYAIVFSLILSTMLGVGYSVNKYNEISVTDYAWVAIFIGSLLCFSVINFFLLTCPKWTLINKGLLKKPVTSSNMHFFRSWAIIFICWVPVFLAEYPGFFVYDAYDEYMEVAQGLYTTHHPLLHVLMLGGSVFGSETVFGSANLGIAFYILIQMIFVSALFAWILNHFLISKVGYLLSIFWFGLFPTVVMFALCSVKDTLFAAFMLLAVANTLLLFEECKKRKETMPTIIALGISLCGMMLMRNNGVYAVLLFAVATIIYVLLQKKERKDNRNTVNIWAIILMLFLSFFAYKIVDYSLIKITNASDAESQEILTVPIQQLARTYQAYKNEMSKEDIETLYEILPEKALKNYTPNLSDPVKAYFDNERYASNPSKYRALWWKLFKEHPLGYLNAWLCTSYGYYYPGTIVNVYEGHAVFTITYTESSYFGYEVESPGKRISLIPIIDRVYRWLSLNDDVQRIPIISFLFSMAGMLWIYIISIMICLYRKDYLFVVSLVLPMATCLTLLLGPTFLPRYTVFFWFIFPLVMHRIFEKEQ